MIADSPDLVIAKRLLDCLKLNGFQFRRVAPGEDGALVGNRVSDRRLDLIHIERIQPQLLRVPQTGLVIDRSRLTRDLVGARIRAVSESPWAQAYEQMRDFVNSGATPGEVLAFAQDMGASPPPPGSPEDHALFAQVRAEVIADSEPVPPKMDPFTE